MNFIFSCSTLEDKIHIHARACNILYVSGINKAIDQCKNGLVNSSYSYLSLISENSSLASSCRVLKVPYFSINTRDRHLDPYSIDIPTNTQLTLDRQLISSRLIFHQVLTDSYTLIENYSTPDQLSTEMLIECRLSINRVLIESIAQGY